MREREYLKLRYAAILSSVGIILVLSGVVMLTPLLILPAYPVEATHAWAFILPACCAIVLGAGFWGLFHKNFSTSLSTREGGVIVLISWILVILFSAWPFMTILGLPFSRAVFESVSGWTTTGLSVVDVTTAGPLILIWRSIVQWFGGAGLAILMMSAIVGPAGISISSAEGRSDQLVPNVRQSARLVMIIYSCYAIVGTVAYWMVGMSFFDAINHSFAAVSTGGFSTRPESIGYWNSQAVEAVTLPLMFLGNFSFVTAWLLWRGRIRAVTRNGELRLFGVLLVISVAGLFLLTSNALYPPLGKSFRVAFFESTSALTTTGFSTVSYANWNAFGIFLLVVLMVVGGGTCSTAGGIKQFRIFLLWKVFIWEIKKSLMPQTAVLERPVGEGERRIFLDDARIRQVSVFVFIYLMIFAFGVLILCSCGFDLRESIFEFASALGTVGLSVGVTSAHMPDVALWAETFAMFLGRLEFFVVITSLVKIIRDSSVIMKRSINGM